MYAEISRYARMSESPKRQGMASILAGGPTNETLQVGATETDVQALYVMYEPGHQRKSFTGFSSDAKTTGTGWETRNTDNSKALFAKCWK